VISRRAFSLVALTCSASKHPNSYSRAAAWSIPRHDDRRD
jgi:hypothetical protein